MSTASSHQSFNWQRLVIAALAGAIVYMLASYTLVHTMVDMPWDGAKMRGDTEEFKLLYPVGLGVLTFIGYVWRWIAVGIFGLVLGWVVFKSEWFSPVSAGDIQLLKYSLAPMMGAAALSITISVIALIRRSTTPAH